MISRTDVVISNEILKFPTVEWREATARMNKTPDTMKMDLGQNILEKSLLILSEAKASWVYTRLAQKKILKSHRMHTLAYKIASNLKNL